MGDGVDYMITMMQGGNYTNYVRDMYKWDDGNGYPCWDVLYECSAGNGTTGTPDLEVTKDVAGKPNEPSGETLEGGDGAGRDGTGRDGRRGSDNNAQQTPLRRHQSCFCRGGKTRHPRFLPGACAAPTPRRDALTPPPESPLTSHTPPLQRVGRRSAVVFSVC